MAEETGVMGYCMYPGGIHQCIHEKYSERYGIGVCGKCRYFTSDHPDTRKIMIDNPDFLEIN